MINRNAKKLEWWESEGGFFGDIYKEMDDSNEGHLNQSKKLGNRTKEEVKGITELCKIGKDAKILYCPCGYGRHSMGLARDGFKVVGVDINDKFLKYDQTELKKSGLKNCSFVKGDMRNINYVNEFNAIINMFYSFGFFNKDEENKLVAEKFYRALKPRGKFLMHTHVTVPRLVSGELKNNQVRNLNSGNKLELERKYNVRTKREDGVWRLRSKDGKLLKTLTPYTMRIYTTDEWVALCKEVGFRKVELFGDWHGSKYNEDSAQLIAVATK